jgi:hypothetical protein
MVPLLPSYFYYVSIILQAVCVIHCLRRGNQQRWIWLIIFLPFIGCITYFFTEIVSANQVRGWQSGAGGLFGSVGRISRLENNIRFTDTFNNRVMLADAYMAAGRTDEAIELYASSLTGAFTENEYVIKQLVSAYFEKQRYAETIVMARKLYVSIWFVSSGDGARERSPACF